MTGNERAVVTLAMIVAAGALTAYLWLTQRSKVSAEDRASPTGAEVGSPLDRYLALQVLKLADIEQNRRGALSAREARRVDIGVRLTKRVPLLALVGMVVLALVVGVAFYLRSKRIGAFAFPAVVAAALVPIMIWVGGASSAVARAIRDGRVEAVDGAVTGVVPVATWDNFAVSVGGRSLTGYGMLDMADYLRANDGHVRAYVLPGVDIVVAFEPLHK
ncbi:MAG TPA: hypothetical protein VKE22_03005 [Haliangiales bacterium]|nr:hypothetical protein [Haliangiales bacterium]